MSTTSTRLGARKTARRAKEAEPQRRSGRGVAAVDRALQILAAFREDDANLPLATIAARTSLYKSTILRLIASLEEYGYVRRLASGAYQLGPAVLHLGTLYQQAFKLDSYVVPVLRQLVAQTSESGSFYVAEGKHRLCLFRVDSPQAVRDHVRIGDLLPLDQGASGRILAAFANGVPHANVREAKFVIATFGERQPDTAAVACPVLGPENRLVGSICVSGPRVRFTKDAVERASRTLVAAARTLSRELGGNPALFPST